MRSTLSIEAAQREIWGVIETAGSRFLYIHKIPTIDRRHEINTQQIITLYSLNTLHVVYAGPSCSSRGKHLSSSAPLLVTSALSSTGVLPIRP